MESGKLRNLGSPSVAVGATASLFVSTCDSSFEHVFFEAAFFEEVVLKLPEKLVEQVVCLVDEADYYIGDDLGRSCLKIGPIGLIGHIFC